MSSTGWLALIATPIGNLEDITYRAIRLLGEADVVAAEDTRRSQGLLTRYNLHKPLLSYHMHNEHQRTDALLARVERGEKVALLTDAGTPAISDPGFLLVRAALARGIEPLVVPGVSAVTYAAVAAGVPVNEFLFAGYLPPHGQKRRRKLAELASACGTLMLFESPFRVTRLLEDVVEVCGAEARVVLLREVTKLHEEHLRGTAAELLAAHSKRTWKGEFTVVVHAPHLVGTQLPPYTGPVHEPGELAEGMPNDECRMPNAGADGGAAAPSESVVSPE